MKKGAAEKDAPWFADPHYGNFRMTVALSREIDTLVAWSDTGAPQVILRHASAHEFYRGLAHSQADVVFEMPNDFTVPAAGTIEYQYVVVPPVSPRTMGAVFRGASGNRALVHHIIAFIREPVRNG